MLEVVSIVANEERAYQTQYRTLHEYWSIYLFSKLLGVGRPFNEGLLVRCRLPRAPRRRLAPAPKRRRG